MQTGFDTLISTGEVLPLLGKDNTVILDCRYSLTDYDAGRKEYLKRHIPGAYYLDLGHDLSAHLIKGVTGRHPLPNPDVLAFTLRAAGLNSDSQVLAYDQSNGAYASRAWWLLNWLGHEHVAVLNGGFGAWEKEGLPTDNQWPAPKSGNFNTSMRTDLMVLKEYVHDTEDTIVDSRAYERFTGEKEPLDPVAGHIKGAICLPFTNNLQPDGYWKSPQELAEKFASPNLSAEENPIFYCGSGVTACHNLLAYKVATGRHARLYPGSWSEWINYYPPTIGE